MAKRIKKQGSVKNKQTPLAQNRQKYLFYLAVFLIILAGIVCYGNSMKGAFVFDDLLSIVDNPSIRSLSRITDTFHAPPTSGTVRRPFVNFTLALNYAISGTDVWSYHVFNLMIHIMAALALFGIIRRTLLSKTLVECYGSVAVPLAFAGALVWMIHPLQTQAVTYVIQRCESLMGLCFLTTLYCVIRARQSAVPVKWHLLAVFIFILGVGSKEIILVAPVLLILYEFLFFRSSLKEILLRSWLLYAGMMAGLVLLFGLIAATAQESITHFNPFTTQQYWQTQPQVILHYLRLAIWPHPLCFDYDWPVASISNALPYIVILVVIIAVSLWLLVKRNPLSFLTMWFLVILMPTSTVPLRDLAWEYRMYLSLAALSVGLVIGIYHMGNFLQKRFGSAGGISKTAVYILFFVAVSMSLGILTIQRNFVYREDITLWEDTVLKAPHNARAHMNLGAAFEKAGRPYDASRRFQEAIRLRPDYAEAYTNMGNVLTSMGKTDEAVAYFRKAISLKPADAIPYVNTGIALTRVGKKEEAISFFREAIRLKPDYAEAYSNLGVALGMSGRLPEAVENFIYALKLKPDLADAHSNLGLAFGRLGKLKEAEYHFQQALRINPGYREARINLEILRKMEGISR